MKGFVFDLVCIIGAAIVAALFLGLGMATLNELNSFHRGLIIIFLVIAGAVWLFYSIFTTPATIITDDEYRGKGRFQ
jgi:hypothetical protein